MSSKSRQVRWGDWQRVDGEEWSGYYREGKDHHGRLKQEWRADEVPEDDEGKVPRQVTEVDELAEQFSGQSIQAYGSSYSGSPTYTHAASSDYASTTAKSKGKGIAQEKPQYKSGKESSKSRSSKNVASSKHSKSHSGKDRSGQTEAAGGDPFYGAAQDEGGEPASYPAAGSSQGHGHAEPRESDEAEESVSPTGYAQGIAQPASYSGDGYAEGQYGAGGQTAGAGYHYGDSTKAAAPGHSYSGQSAGYQGGSSSQSDWGTREYEDRLDDEADEEWQRVTSGSSSMGAYAPPQEPDPVDDDGRATPRPRISGREDEVPYERLDPRYIIESSYKFQPGAVFKVLWSEPQGQGQKHPKEEVRSLTEKGVKDNEFGEPFFIGLRRFIVVASDDGHSTCVPILTYGRKGCNKRGVKPKKHGIITTHSKASHAKLLPNEPTLGFPTVRMKMITQGEMLAKESRVNYSKLVTVEHNVKVFFIGTVLEKDMELVSDAVDQCWMVKKRKPKSNDK